LFGEQRRACDDEAGRAESALHAPTGEEPTLRGVTRVLDRTRDHERAAAAGGLPRAAFVGGVDDDAHARRVDLQDLDRDLQRDGVDTLAHVGPAVALFQSAVDFETHDRSTDLDQAVAELGVLDTDRDTHRLARRDRGVVVGPHRLETRASTRATVVHDLPRTPDSRPGR